MTGNNSKECSEPAAFSNMMISLERMLKNTQLSADQMRIVESALHFGYASGCNEHIAMEQAEIANSREAIDEARKRQELYKAAYIRVEGTIKEAMKNGSG